MATLQTGTAPNQIPTNGDLGDLAFQSKESVQFTGGRGALSSINLNQIYKEIAVTAVDVFVYDTSKDSDGGAWRSRTQHTSWYNETLNTATRGSRREFPSVAVIVATTSSVIIYDGDDPAMPMWMVFQRGLGYPGWTHLVGGNHASDQISCVSASNAIIVTGLGNGPNETAWAGLYYCNFLLDAGYKTNSSGSYTYNGWFNFPISQRYYSYANDSQFSTKTVPFLVNSFVRDVAMTVLPNAPIDAATGLPIPTIAVATAGGVSVIKDNGTVINLLTTSGTQNSISFTSSKGLETHGGGGVAFFGWGWYSVPQASTNTSDYLISDNAWSTTNIRRPGSNGNSVLYPMTTTNYGIVIRESAGVSTTDKLILIALTNPAGYSLQNYLTTKYNTGWMPGDIRGAWLSDTTQETMVGSELVTNGDGNSATGWTAGGGNTLISTGGNLKCTTNIGDGAYFGQGISVIFGKTYTFTATIISDGTSKSAKMFLGTANGFGNISGAPEGYTFGSTSITWTATSTTTVWLWFYGSVATSGTYILVDNISARISDPDRSVNNKGLQIFGSITKSAVATGADLVAYSGFSSSNYLMQPYNALLDFTGDFSWSLWYYHVTNSATEYILYRAPFANGQPKTEIFINTDNTLGIYIQDLGALASPAIQPNSWHHIIATRRSGIVSFYLNSVLVNSGASTVNLTNTNAILSLGLRTSGGYNGINGRLALVRASATAPSAEQIAKMYNDEKYLFQDGAKATLYGASDSVTALAYDEDTRLLHVGTSSGRSVFNGLRRVDNTTTAVSASISAVAGLVAEQ